MTILEGVKSVAGALGNGNKPLTVQTLVQVATIAVVALWANGKVNDRFDGLRDQLAAQAKATDEKLATQAGINTLVLERLRVHEESIKAWQTERRIAFPLPGLPPK